MSTKFHLGMIKIGKKLEFCDEHVNLPLLMMLNQCLSMREFIAYTLKFIEINAICNAHALKIHYLKHLFY